MVLLREALNRIRDLVNTDIDKGQLGTGTTTPLESDTGLESAEAATLLATASTTADATATSKGSLLTETYTLPSTTGTGTTYNEFEVQSSTASKNYTRIIINPTSGYAHTSTKELKVITRLFFRNEQ